VLSENLNRCKLGTYFKIEKLRPFNAERLSAEKNVGLWYFSIVFISHAIECMSLKTSVIMFVVIRVVLGKRGRYS